MTSFQLWQQSELKQRPCDPQSLRHLLFSCSQNMSADPCFNDFLCSFSVHRKHVCYGLNKKYSPQTYVLKPTSLAEGAVLETSGDKACLEEVGHWRWFLEVSFSWPLPISLSASCLVGVKRRPPHMHLQPDALVAVVSYPNVGYHMILSWTCYMLV
jgi:hypothetical protein